VFDLEVFAGVAGHFGRALGAHGTVLDCRLGSEVEQSFNVFILLIHQIFAGEGRRVGGLPEPRRECVVERVLVQPVTLDLGPLLRLLGRIQLVLLPARLE